MVEIFIQPQIKNFDKYKRYAYENNLNFEIVDFASPDVLESNFKKIVKEYKKKLKDNKKLLSKHGAFIDLYINSPDSRIKKVSQGRIFQNLKIAKDLGIKYAVFHTNALPMMTRKEYYENWVKEHVRFWKNVISEFEITILLENMWDTTPKFIAQVIKKVNSPYLKVCFDTGHFNIFSKVSLEQWFKQLNKNITYIHVNDNHGKEDSELPPGKGNFNWNKFNRCAKKYCRDPYVVIEVRDLNAIKKSIDYLKKQKIYPYS